MKLRVLTNHTSLSAHPKTLSTEQPRRRRENRKAVSRERGVVVAEK